MTWDLTPNIAAGFFDGDGTVDILDTKHKRETINVNSLVALGN